MSAPFLSKVMPSLLRPFPHNLIPITELTPSTPYIESMSNTNPFQSSKASNPYGATQTSSSFNGLVANTLNTHLSAQGIGRQAFSSTAQNQISFRPSV